MSEPINGAREHSKAERRQASERSERCERTKVASDQVANALNRVTILVRDNLSQRLVYLKIGETIISAQKKQVTRGHNIVAEGWAGASNPHLHPMPPTNTHKKHLKRLFFHFSTCALLTDGRTNRQTNGRTKPIIELRVRN